ncbi:extracellular solute-binding protein [Paenibacillus sp. J2TS4]|uniref:extracellular solute-binding protein n=1 Tax=Paenibacillus sp. J2TS4 TaxID=2807194 RepID=UPI001B2CF1FB|nr:extracellular solute-binding protein [Paenibacillus sp. J2TS4]GIP34819.1 hypothetical protein J2TS4_40290 [Paenibacillus sp. J2TS4]
MRRENEFLYMRLYGILKEQILTGLIQPGNYLLPENELCRCYSMSRNSVRKALEQLQNDGLVIKRPGLGTMVPVDLAIQPSDRSVLRILAPYPAHFVDNGLPSIIKAFSKLHPHVDVQLLSLPALHFWDSFQTCCHMGMTPDVVLVSDLHLTDRDRLAAFTDLRDPLSSQLDFIYPKLLNHFRYDDQLIAAPLTFTPTFLAFNPTLFASEGIPLPTEDWTLDDFCDAARRLTQEQDARIIRYGLSIFPQVSRWPVFALQNQEAGAFDGLTADSLRKALSLIQDLLYHQRAAIMYPQHDTNPFLYEKSAMTLTTLFEMSSWKDRSIDFTPEAAPLPFGPTKATLLQANSLMIPMSANHPELALAFVQIALEPDVQRTMCESTPFLSVLPQVNEATRTRQLLHALNVQDPFMDNNLFLYELFGESAMDELKDELALFWLGLETADAVTDAVAKAVAGAWAKPQ